eukprot:1596937-Prymnesium_polylepis.2
MLLNSLAVELVVLCMMYSSPDEGPVVINPVRVISSGCVAALVCIPAAVVFAWCFTPIAFVRLGRLLLLLPFRVLMLIARGLREAVLAGTWRREPRPTSSPPLSPP